MILLRPGAELNVTILDEQMLIRGCHIDMPLADRTTIGWMHGWERSLTTQNRWQMTEPRSLDMEHHTDSGREIRGEAGQDSF